MNRRPDNRNYSSSQRFPGPHKEVRVDPSTRNGVYLFRCQGQRSLFFTQRARDRFSRGRGEYLDFTEFPGFRNGV